MRNYIIDIITEESKKLIFESGIKDISKLSKRYQKAKIYFHQDLDESSFRVNKGGIIKNALKYINKNILIKEETFGATWKSPIPRDADLLHAFERRKSDKQGALIGTQIEEKLKKLYDTGINPDITDLKLNVNSKDAIVTWEATIGPSADGKAYMGISTRGSTGGGSEKRALDQVGPLKRQLSSKGYQDITPITFDGKDHFVNPSGNKIHQYFFKYTDPNKYPPHKTKVSYDRTQEPLVVSLNAEDPSMKTELSSNTNYSVCSGESYKKGCKDPGAKYNKPNSEGIIYKVQGCIGTTQDGFFGKNTEKSLKDKFGKSEFKLSDVNSLCKDVKVVNTNNESVGSSDFASITKTVIDKLEGGYWNGSTIKNESTTKMGICKNHPKGSMGESTETMFGLDRYNGNIESTPEGKEFFRIIDEEKQNLGMKAFCQKWTWLYRGGDKEEILKDLVIKNRKASYDRNMSNFVNAETKQKVESIPGLTLHMSYATWNGPGSFKKFAKSLENKIKTGASDQELIELAISDRSKTNLPNKAKTESAIRSA